MMLTILNEGKKEMKKVNKQFFYGKAIMWGQLEIPQSLQNSKVVDKTQYNRLRESCAKPWSSPNWVYQHLIGQLRCRPV